MRKFVPVEWRILRGEWNAFLSYVEAEYGENDRHTAREVDIAMREWIESNETNDISEVIDDLIALVGDAFEDAEAPEKNFSEILDEPGESEQPIPKGELVGKDKTKVRVRIDPDLKARFKELADEGDLPVGTCFAQALRARRTGQKEARREARQSRHKHRLTAVRDDLAALVEDDEEDPYADLSAVARRKEQMIDYLAIERGAERGVQVPRTVIHDAIDSVMDGCSDPTEAKYTERITDELGLVEHTQKPDMFVSRRDMELEALRDGDTPHPDAPVCDLKDPSDLSEDERVEAVKVAVARARVEHAEGSFGFSDTPLTVEKLSDAAFGGAFAESTVRRSVKRASHSPGWECRETAALGGGKTRTKLSIVDDDELLTDDPGYEAISHDRRVARERAKLADVDDLTDAGHSET